MTFARLVSTVTAKMVSMVSVLARVLARLFSHGTRAGRVSSAMSMDTPNRKERRRRVGVGQDDVRAVWTRTIPASAFSAPGPARQAEVAPNRGGVKSLALAFYTGLGHIFGPPQVSIGGVR